MIPPCSVMPDASLMPSAARYWDRILGGLSRMDTNPRIATRTARAVRKLAARGVVRLEDYPLLMHVDDIINRGAAVDIPWEKFTTIVES